MKISVKKIHQEIEVRAKTDGIEFSVRDEVGKHLGDFYVKKTGIVWCRGKTAVENGMPLSWTKFIALAERGYRD